MDFLEILLVDILFMPYFKDSNCKGDDFPEYLHVFMVEDRNLISHEDVRCTRHYQMTRII